MKKEDVAQDIDAYIQAQPEPMRGKLSEIRQAIQSAAPTSVEVISYNMPAFKLNGILVYFAGCKNHIGFYPTGSGIAAFEKELTGYKYSKGAVQFPLDKPLPLALIKRMVKFRVKQDAEALKRTFFAKKANGT